MKKHFSFIAGLFLVMFTSLYCFAASPAEEISKHPELSGKLENGVRVIEVKASRYKFEPDPIVVGLGEKVRLIVTSADVAHGLAIQELNVKLSIPAGKTEHIEFIADKQGEFQAYCSVYCGPGHGHMQASFIVK
ncbi:MAG: cupredoxin domain-containing protein [Candidatus Omnitrophica bacterium]|nr:cupredoxin domain-containing protein [Candidatus Omnitrophota bacterium]MBU4303214.1 cupredoxin domain-containing protein [Candidatus Omnitrophota bacterium]MBU4418588.1 cupredoxin domain-containing protein [Candidatus Omnitrophota bacterium]MBU4467530.1 cupredoxin domain-containing protein [Candidatus Omnitrophota bacterium]MCG2707465.1 cupredoxin domain-containing protein [Candidatus Omnitrophota bacterium]